MVFKGFGYKVLVDATELVCEGAVSVIVPRAQVLQIIGDHMTGLVQTETISEIQDELAERRDCSLLLWEGSVFRSRPSSKQSSIFFNRLTFQG